MVVNLLNSFKFNSHNLIAYITILLCTGIYFNQQYYYQVSSSLAFSIVNPQVEGLKLCQAL